VVLHHLVELPVEEIASQLNVPVGTVKSRLSRGRTALARRLAAPGPEEDPKNPRDPRTFPFVELYGPHVQVHLSKPNGRKGSIVGPYSIIEGTTYQTLRAPTGAQAAIAWNCDAPPGTVPP
jgi:hypothetical protein